MKLEEKMFDKIKIKKKYLRLLRLETVRRGSICPACTRAAGRQGSGCDSRRAWSRNAVERAIQRGIQRGIQLLLSIHEGCVHMAILK